MSDTDYIRGQRQAWSTLLATAMRELGMTGCTLESLVLEREATVAALRSVCEEYGDNDWEDELHLADVIEKHLARPLHELHRAGDAVKAANSWYSVERWLRIAPVAFTVEVSYAPGVCQVAFMTGDSRNLKVFDPETSLTLAIGNAGRWCDEQVASAKEQKRG